MNAVYFIPLAFLVVVTLTGFSIWSSLRKREAHQTRAAYINAYQFPATLRGKLALKHAGLTPEQLDLVFRALRQYFQACLEAGAVKRGRSVGMPSRVVDDVWHDFMLMSREYTAFCHKAFGGYLHHAPDSEMKVSMPTALGNTLEAIKARKGTATGVAILGGVPLLFAIDSALAIDGGFKHDTQTIAAIEAKRNGANQAAGGSCSGGGVSIDNGGASTGCGQADGGSCSGGDGGGGCGGGGCGSE
jgi:hypothetical protein